MIVYLSERISNSRRDTLAIFATFEEAKTYILNSDDFQMQLFGSNDTYFVTPVALGSEIDPFQSVQITE
jgi:hypothetical protein